MRVLKFLHRPDCDDAMEVANLDAVLEAYRCDKINSNQISVWFSGHIVMGPLPSSNLDLESVVKKVLEWESMVGPGRIWIEACHCDFILMTREL
jgi:hypothetical protein